MTEPLDMAHFQSWIGREDSATDVVTAGLVQKFRATVGLPETADDLAPRLIHFCLAIPAVPLDEVGPDGHPKRGGFLPPVPLPRRMWAGGEISFHGDLRVGDAVKRTSRIASVTAKEGRSGTLCFVDVDHKIEANGRLVVEERHNIVYRDVNTSTPAAPPAPRGEETRVITPTPVQLFRYSALTFNSHRIHYDAPYTKTVEGYPDLVVHGPLQATLVLHYAAELMGKPPTRFSFRGQSPLFADAPFTLHSAREDNRMKLWTARENGPVAMTAEAVWP